MADAEWGTPQWALNQECECGFPPEYGEKKTNAPGPVKNHISGQVGSG